MADSRDDVLKVVDAYVKAVRSGDNKALRATFADDMEMVCRPMAGVESGRMKGGDAIAQFYAKLLKDRGGADPHPGPLIVAGDRVAVEIDAHHAAFIDEVADFFTIRGGKIVRLAVYSAGSRPK
jgi:ketosteroid isomerase-like protein